MDKLTPIQREVLNALRRRSDGGEAPPSYRDLCREFGWSSTGTARDHLRALARKGCIKLAGGRARLTRLNETAAVVRVPLLGHVQAGSPSPAEEIAACLVPVPEGWVESGSAFALTVLGDSMVGAGVHDGDIVILRKQRSASDGDVVAATIDAETTLKRFRRIKGRIVLAAENPAYAPIELDHQNFVIHGVAVGLLRRLPPRPAAVSMLGDLE